MLMRSFTGTAITDIASVANVCIFTNYFHGNTLSVFFMLDSRSPMSDLCSIIFSVPENLTGHL